MATYERRYFNEHGEQVGAVVDEVEWAHAKHCALDMHEGRPYRLVEERDLGEGQFVRRYCLAAPHGLASPAQMELAACEICGHGPCECA